MTDYNELVNQLREYLVNTEISDALKAQAKEIAELKNQLYGVKGSVSTTGVLEEAVKFQQGWADALRSKEKLAARIAELEADLVEWKLSHESRCKGLLYWKGKHEQQSARIADLEAENKKLRGLLKPFAAVTEDEIELWYGLEVEGDPLVPDDADLLLNESSPTVGDLRAARAALNGEN